MWTALVFACVVGAQPSAYLDAQGHVASFSPACPTRIEAGRFRSEKICQRRLPRLVSRYAERNAVGEFDYRGECRRTAEIR